MEEAKVSELPNATNVNDNDLMMIVQGGYNKQVTKKIFQESILLEKSMITVRPTAGATLTTANTEIKVPLEIIEASIGTGLTLKTTDDSIVIGEGVTAVRITANIYWFTGAKNYRGITAIKKNNTQIARSLNYIADNYIMTTIDTGLIEVDEGDEITLHLTCSGANAVVSAGQSRETCLTVEAIN